MLLFNFYIFTFLLNFTYTFAVFIPNGRAWHSSVLIDNKLYFSGGLKYNGLLNKITNEFFYLDVSKPFTSKDNDSIPWVDLTYTGGPLKTGATACIGGKNNKMIFIFGGFSHSSGDLYANQSFVNQFDTNKQQWINITSVGNVPINRTRISCANFHNGLIAIFSGNFNETYRINGFWIFNTLKLTWSLSNATNAPLSMFGYSAVTLPDGNILYIGGFNSTAFGAPNAHMAMNNSISGPTPPVRADFSAVLSEFGNGTLSSKIFMLDVSQKDSYKWVTEFTPKTTTITTTKPVSTTTSSSNTSSDSKNTSIIIGAIIGSIISLIIFVIANFVCFHKKVSVLNILKTTAVKLKHKVFYLKAMKMQST
ncbi:hypothetical protein C2G38_2032904 [Gigaspora rosea]|uniref:Galactose oxidase n=1 Tax=Gigaspora rosea TaxID=44941 RepID=A0A397VL68_9GLOM|nr:hypothetical protein C2G38_2032904 [Gigaspora rosea]